MSLLIFSDTRKNADSSTGFKEKAFSEKHLSFEEKLKYFIEFYNGDMDNAIFAKKETIIFIQGGIAEYENIPSLQQPMHDGWDLEEKTGDLVFGDTEVTLTKFINSFIYKKKPNTSLVGKQDENNYIKPYGPKYPSVTIFLFAKKLTAQISNLITRAVGIDVFGRTHRKIYVIAIPILYHKNFNEVNEYQIVDNYVSYLIDLLSYRTEIRDVLSAFPGSKHFAQREQMDGEGDEDDLKNSLIDALKVSVEVAPNINVRISEQVEEKIKEIKSSIVGRSLENKEISDSYDEINCTAYAPKDVAVGNEFIIQVFIHTYIQTFELDEIAKYADDDAQKRGNITLQEKILRGSKLDFQLTISGIEIEEDSISMVWNGKINSAQFSIKVHEAYKPTNLVDKILVLQDSVPVGQIKFSIKVVHPVTSWKKEYYSKPRLYANESSAMLRFEKAFISYASPDRSEVLKRVQMLSLIKLDFFQDLLTLVPGDEWEAKIYDYIDNCDVFLIFWSKAASESEWVKKETLYALKIKNSSARLEIIPVIIEGPPPAKPPEELNFLHFNDKFIYFINSA